MPSFDTNLVQAALTTLRFRDHLHHHTSVPSTMTLALEAALSGAETGVWVADEQTAGRGRGGHTWHSIPGEGLYVSVLIRPRIPLAHALWLSLATGLAAKHAIAEITGLTPDIRWPNDLLLNKKKCGGILVETASDPGTAQLRHAIIGIGINTNHQSFPAALEPLATSLALATGRTHAREPLLAGLLNALDREITLLETSTAPDLLARFGIASTWVTGKRVRVGEDPGSYTGTTAGLNAQGFLQVDGDDGQRHTVLSGGVREL